MDKVSFSRELRRNQTKTESILWSKLRARQLNGIKFRRQCLVGPFIVDFICFEKHLVVEIDGDIHDLPAKRAQDKRRDMYFKNSGYTVLHISNDNIIHNLSGVLEEILRS